MKNVIAPLLLSLFAAPALALKPCEELKSEIVAKLDAKGVKDYQVDIVPAGDVKDQTVVGTCEGGTKKIIYRRSASSPAPVSPASAKKPSQDHK